MVNSVGPRGHEEVPPGREEDLPNVPDQGVNRERVAVERAVNYEQVQELYWMDQWQMAKESGEEGEIRRNCEGDKEGIDNGETSGRSLDEEFAAAEVLFNEGTKSGSWGGIEGRLEGPDRGKLGLSISELGVHRDGQTVSGVGEYGEKSGRIGVSTEQRISVVISEIENGEDLGEKRKGTPPLPFGDVYVSLGM